MANFTLRPMTVSERKYSYVQSPQIQGRPAISVIYVVISALTATGFTPLGLIPVHNGKVMSLSKTWTM